MIALSTVEGYHGYLLFAWMYGIFLGGYQFCLKVYTLERVRVRQFPRGWGFVQGAKFLPILIGIPVCNYISESSLNRKAGFYLSLGFVLLGAIILFLMDCFNQGGSNNGGPLMGVNSSLAGSTRYLSGSKDGLCKTDTNLTLELFGHQDQGQESTNSFQVGSNDGVKCQRRYSDSYGQFIGRKDSQGFLLQAPPSNNNHQGQAEVEGQILRCTCDHKMYGEDGDRWEPMKNPPPDKAIDEKPDEVLVDDHEGDNEGDINGIIIVDDSSPDEPVPDGQDLVAFVSTAGEVGDSDEEVEEGGDIIVDEEVLAQAVLEEPELLSCISEANCDSVVAAANEASQHLDGGELVKKDVLDIISEEEEESAKSSNSSSSKEVVLNKFMESPCHNNEANGQDMEMHEVEDSKAKNTLISIPSSGSNSSSNAFKARVEVSSFV